MSEQTEMQPERPKGRTKGYTSRSRKNSVARQRFLERRRKRIVLTGVVGVVENLYDKIDEELRKRNWNWATLARELSCTPQYLVKVTAKSQMPFQFFCLICQVLDWDHTAVMVTPEEGEGDEEDESGEPEEGEDDDEE